ALRLRRQLAVNQEVARLDEVALLGEVFDRVAAVAQDALFAIEVRDRTRGRSGVHEPAVERDVTGVLAQVTNVDGVLVFRADDDGQRSLFPSGEDKLRTQLLGSSHGGQT